MRTVALEEHFATPAFMDGPGRKLKERAEQTGGRLANLVAGSSMSATAASRRWMLLASTCRRCR